MEERKFTDRELVRRQKLQELKDLGIDHLDRDLM